MSYNRFQWWRSLPRHKKKDERSHPTARIENGDFEYPWDVEKDLEYAQADLRRLEQDLENQLELFLIMFKKNFKLLVILRTKLANTNSTICLCPS